MPEKRGKILVIRGGAIGDFVLTLPVLAALHATFPDTHLELLGYPKVAELARAAQIIDQFRSIEARPLARFFARNAKLDEEWSAYFDSFHLIISYLYDPDDIFKTNIGRASKAQFIQGPHRPNEKEDLHATAVFLKPLESLAIYNPDPIPQLSLAASERLSGRWLATHPGSGSESKNWPEQNWRDLFARLLAETDFNLLLVAGEAEEDRVNQMSLALPPGRIHLARNLPLSELAGLLSTTRLFIGHDSGITHIAASLGLPALVLWGPSKQTIWRPLNPGVRLLQDARALEHLTVESVFRQAGEILSDSCPL